jgi:hypothetical protein
MASVHPHCSYVASTVVADHCAIDVQHWFGIAPEGCDVPHWMPYLDAETIGLEPARKIIVPIAMGPAAVRAGVV